jgi:F-type H+-transporting ATPase subunit delta
MAEHVDKSIHTKQHAAALSYANALLALANEKQQAEVIGQELKDIATVIDASPSFGAFLRDPAVSIVDQQKLLNNVFAGKVNPLVHNTLGVMANKGRLGLVREVIDAYHDLLDEQLGKIEVDVTVARRLDGPELENVRQRISAALKKDVVIHQYVDENIIGGLVIRVQDKLIDASVKSQLDTLKKKLIAAAPR